MKATKKSQSTLKVERENYYAVIEFHLSRAKDIPKMDLNGEADPFCVFKLADRVIYTSKIIYKTRQPVWGETFRMLVPESEKNYNLSIEVWDWDKISKNDYVGLVTLDLAQCYVNKTRKEWYPITLESKKNKKMKPRGDLELEYRVFSKDQVEKEFWKGVYDHFDIDNDGNMSRLELSCLLEGIGSKMNDQQLAQLFDEFDADKSGTMSFDELYGMVSSDKFKSHELVQLLLPKDKDLPWRIFAEAGPEGYSVGTSVLGNWNVKLMVPTDKGKRKAAEIMVHNRETGKLEEEKIPNYIKVAMRVMYGSAGRVAVDSKQIKKIMKSMTVQQGKKYNLPVSVKEIEPFIEFHQLSREEMLDSVDSFATFNEFFYRKLKPSARLIAAPADPKVAVSPADCRLNVFPTIKEATEIWIKGSNFTISTLIQDSELAKRYDGGSLVIARLAPQDYHRFHIPVNGTLGKPVPIDGTYYTVNPIAVNTSVDVYTENKRVVCPIQSPEFGLVTFVAIGATMVGSICLTTQEGQTVAKGDEHGYFAFGGSTVILLFPPNSIQFDEDLVINSQKPVETLVKMGASLGRAVN